MLILFLSSLLLAHPGKHNGPSGAHYHNDEGSQPNKILQIHVPEEVSSVSLHGCTRDRVKVKDGVAIFSDVKPIDCKVTLFPQGLFTTILGSSHHADCRINAASIICTAREQSKADNQSPKEVYRLIMDEEELQFLDNLLTQNELSGRELVLLKILKMKINALKKQSD